MPHRSQVTGIGQPQYRWRESSQSRRRYPILNVPRPSLSSHSDDPACPSAPLKSPELTSTSSSECATKAPSVATGSAAAHGRRDDCPDREAAPLREREVALVMRGDAHDGARPVLHEHVVRHPDRIGLPVAGLTTWRPVKTPSFSFSSRSTAECAAARVLDHLGLALGAGDEVGTERVPGCEHEEGGAEDRPAAWVEDRDLVVEFPDAEDEPAPSLRPIQLRCMARTRSGHDSSSAISSSRASA